jgi:hypothetical protein
MKETNNSEHDKDAQSNACKQKLILAIQALSDLKHVLAKTPGRHQKHMSSFTDQMQEFAAMAERLYNKSVIDQDDDVSEETEELRYALTLAPQLMRAQEMDDVGLDVVVELASSDATGERFAKKVPRSERFESWQQIKGFEFDDPQAAKPFSRQLIEKYFWSEKYTQQLIEGFRQFVFVYVVFGTAAPPPEIDKVFHAVLLDTNIKDKLEALINKELRHDPGNGSTGQEAAILDAYADTYYLVCKHFGEPDPRIWPKV